MTILSHLLFQIFILLGLVAGGFFVFQNTEVVTLTIANTTFESTPLWLAIFISFVIGLIVGYALRFNQSSIKK